jgi:hypothetical protein
MFTPPCAHPATSLHAFVSDDPGGLRENNGSYVGIKRACSKTSNEKRLDAACADETNKYIKMPISVFSMNFQLKLGDDKNEFKVR